MQRLDSRSPLRLITAFLMMLVLALLGACAGMQKPVTAQDYVQSAKGQVTAAYKSIGDLKAQGSISSLQGIGYLERVDAISRNVTTVQKLADGGAEGSISSLQGIGYLERVDAISRNVTTVQKLADGGADLTTVQGALKTTLAGLVLLQAELNAKGK